MASQFNSLPNYPVPLLTGGNTGRDWYRFWAGLFQGLPPGNIEAVVLGASPYLYSATRKGTVIIQGGTVSSVQFSRDGTTFISTGQTSGMFTVGASDLLRVTYSVLPAMTFLPT